MKGSFGARSPHDQDFLDEGTRERRLEGEADSDPQSGFGQVSRQSL